jgi:MYXO-CTERM domain-containing protein
MNRAAARRHDRAAHVGPTRKLSWRFRQSLIAAAVHLLVLVILTVPLVLASSGPALACSCDDGSLEDDVAAADLVVIGTVSAPDAPGLDPSADVQYDVTVDEIYKGGPVGAVVAVKSKATGASCGWEGIERDTDYAVFAWFDESGRFHGSLCGGTTTATPALVKELAELTRPAKLATDSEFPAEPDDTIPPPGDPDTPWALGSLTVLGLGALGWWRYRRRSD